ncbi:MAG: immunoglobulin domain-containing protein, partial [Phycisphaerae bacterium]
NATFTVTATGTGLTFQWRKNGVNIADGATGNGASTYSGTTTNTLTINGVDPGDAALAAAGFDVVVSGTCNPPVTSNRVALTVNEAPAITVQPTDQTVNGGDTATFTVTATGTGLTFQWRKNGVNIADGATGNGASTYSGTNTATLTINNTDAGDAAAALVGFDVVITGTCNPPVTSNRVALTVN